MGVAFLYGNGGSGGASLNYKIVGGTSAPSNPKENTIWVNTSTAITSHVFSATQPTGSAGMVWIQTGVESGVAFNALKKNGIQVYPLFAKQYVSGAWVAKTAKSYQGGKWVTWWNGQLYDNGNQYTEVTGGWELAWKGAIGTGSLTLDSAKMVINKEQDIDYIRVRTAQKINLNGFEKLHMTFTTAYKDPDTSDKYWGIQIAIGADNVVTESPNYIAFAESSQVQETNKTISVNIPNNTGSQYITIGVIGRSIYHVHKVWAD